MPSIGSTSVRTDTGRAGSGNGVNGADVVGVAGIAQRVVAAWAEHDADAFAEVFTPDGTMILPGDVFKRNRDEIRAFMAAAYAGPYQGTQVTGRPLGVRFIGADVAVMITEGGILLPDETTVAAERQIRATWVAVRDGATWRLAAYHNSRSSAA